MIDTLTEIIELLTCLPDSFQDKPYDVVFALGSMCAQLEHIRDELKKNKQWESEANGR